MLHSQSGPWSVQIRCLIHKTSLEFISRPGHVLSRAFATSQASRTSTPSPALLPSLKDLGLNEGNKVTVAVSGGVDSSVSLKILSELPLELDAIFMRNWDPLLSESNESEDTFSLRYQTSSGSKGQHQCEWERDYEDARAVARQVGLKDDQLRLVDFTKEYWSRVFEPAIDMWQNGGTPNPDVACNREIKFGELMKILPPNKDHFLATGHYALAKRSNDGGLAKLLRSKDHTKDQTYYLSQMSEAQVRRAVFPLAQLKKTEVRELAQYWNLPTATREESMGVCFIGERGKFGDFISQYTTPSTIPGYLVKPDGTKLGNHRGLWYYTIGQKARLAGLGQKWFIARKGVGENGNDILVVPGSDHPSLQCVKAMTEGFHWISGSPIAPLSSNQYEQIELDVQVRHRMTPMKAQVELGKSSSGLIVTFMKPVIAVSPGQILALWDGDRCLGSGTIKQTICVDQLQ